MRKKMLFSMMFMAGIAGGLGYGISDTIADH